MSQGRSERRYAAFISYSHADREWARWLHASLEKFRFPKGLGGTQSPPERLSPIFLDRADVAASTDLGEAVTRALRHSNALIVVCSPSSAASRWVNEEIRQFKALGKADRIFCLIVAGSPNATTRAGRDPAQECLPHTLRHIVTEAGEVTGTLAPEALGADVRPGQDRKRHALLKIIAGVSGLQLDDLIRRDQRRQQRRMATVAAAASFLAVIMAVLAGVAVVAQQRAEEARLLADQQRQRAERQAARASATADFLKSLFKVSDPSVARGSTVTAREVLDRGAERVATNLAEEPDVRSALETTLGEVYTNLGLYDQADMLLERAHLAQQEFGDGGEDLVRSAVARAEVLYLRGDYPLSEQLFREARGLIASGEAADAETRMRMLVGLGEVLVNAEEDAEAEQVLTEARDLGELLPNDVDELAARALSGMATLRFYGGDPEAAQTLFEQALQRLRARFGDDHPKVLETLNQLGAVHYVAGDYDAAERVFAEALPVMNRVFGERHPESAGLLNNYARLLLEKGDYAKAVEYFQQIIDIDIAQKPPTHDDFAFSYNSLGLAQMALGQCDAAERALTRAAEVSASHEHAMHGPILTNLGHLYCEAGLIDAGLKMLARARAAMSTHYAADHWRTAWLDGIEGECLALSGKQAQGLALLEASTPRVIAQWGEQRLFGADAKRRLAGRGWHRTGALDRGAPWFGCYGSDGLGPATADIGKPTD